MDCDYYMIPEKKNTKSFTNLPLSCKKVIHNERKNNVPVKAIKDLTMLNGDMWHKDILIVIGMYIYQDAKEIMVLDNQGLFSCDKYKV